MNNELRIFSVDLETSGLDSEKHEILSIGMVDITIGTRFYKEICYENLQINTKALAINRFDFSKNDTRLSQELVFQKLEAYMTEQMSWYKPGEKYNKRDVRILGLNPSFDLNFLKTKWKKYLTSDFPFSHRTVDLNSIFIYLDIIGVQPGFANNRDFITELADKQIETKEGKEFLTKHNAMNDAIWNVYAWEECIKILQRKTT